MSSPDDVRILLPRLDKKLDVDESKEPRFSTAIVIIIIIIIIIIITVYTDNHTSMTATGLSTLPRALDGVVAQTDRPQTYSACRNIPPGRRPFVTVLS